MTAKEHAEAVDAYAKAVGKAMRTYEASVGRIEVIVPVTALALLLRSVLKDCPSGAERLFLYGQVVASIGWAMVQQHEKEALTKEATLN